MRPNLPPPRIVIPICNFRNSSSPIKVRLKSLLSKHPEPPGRFQFHYGTVKRYKINVCTHYNQEFQFHYGTVKRHLFFLPGRAEVAFQFHYGTVKRSRSAGNSQWKRNFNSTTVRLKENARIQAWPCRAISIPLRYG